MAKYLHTFSAALPKVDAGYDGNIVVPIDIAQYYKSNQQRRVIFRVNKVIQKSGALNLIGGIYFLYLNKGDRRKLHRAGSNQLTIEIGPDHSTYGMPMPSELKEALNLYPEAEKLFERLTPGRQRSIIYTVSKPKGEQTRIRKAIMIMDYLIDYKGKVDLREMNRFMKNYQEKL